MLVVKKCIIVFLFVAGNEKLNMEYMFTSSIEEIAQKVAPAPANVFMQFLLLYKRNIITAKRTYVSFIQFLSRT